MKSRLERWLNEYVLNMVAIEVAKRLIDKIYPDGDFWENSNEICQQVEAERRGLA